SMDLCHQAIADKIKPQPEEPLRNFVSIVSAAEFKLPSSAGLIRGAQLTMQHVKDCFRVLHPEHDDDYGWGIANKVSDKLRNLQRRFVFQHGPRIFGVPGSSVWTDIQPVRLALDALDSSDTRGYVSLLNTESDVLSGNTRQPTPALVGLQFVKNGKCLD